MKLNGFDASKLCRRFSVVFNLHPPRLPLSKLRKPHLAAISSMLLSDGRLDAGCTLSVFFAVFILVHAYSAGHQIVVHNRFCELPDSSR